MAILGRLLGPNKPTISEIENAFQPAKEVTSADRFAGRKQQVSDSYHALLSAGTNIAVIGNRGIGKTSLATQIMNIGGGELSLLDRLSVPHDEKPDFLTMYFACGRTTKTTGDLLEKLLTSHACLADWIYDVPAARKIATGASPKLTAKVLGIGGELSTNATTEEIHQRPALEQSIDVVFSNVANAIAGEGVARDGLLIVVDEFDQIEDRSGFASLLKALATNAPKVRFCIVGVATDIQDLMKEHASADRLFAGSIIALPSMTEAELRQIIDIAEKQIGKYITFEAGAKDRLAQLAQGHPYMVHLIGKYALRSAHQIDRRTISKEDINITLLSLKVAIAKPLHPLLSVKLFCVR